MKKLALSAVLATSLSAPAFAGHPAPPRMEPPVIVADATSSSSSQSTLVLLVLATVIGAVLAAH
ncbi:MAG: hypothetical protein ACRBBV_01015 [Paracoccaceae bacterium]